MKCLLDGDLLFQASFLGVPEGDCSVLRRLIFQRFPFQGKENTFTGISKAVYNRLPGRMGSTANEACEVPQTPFLLTMRSGLQCTVPLRL